MTDIKKTKAGKTAAKAKKLQLNKETLKDLDASKNAQVKGGIAAGTAGGPCTQRHSNCTLG